MDTSLEFEIEHRIIQFEYHDWNKDRYFRNCWFHGQLDLPIATVIFY